MNNELLLLIKKHTDKLIDQTRTPSQETLEFKMNKQMGSFSFIPPKNLSEGKWLLGVTSFGETNSVFNITNENKSFSISTPSYWSARRGVETINELRDLLSLREQNDIKLHVEEVRKRGNQIKIGDKK